MGRLLKLAGDFFGEDEIQLAWAKTPFNTRPEDFAQFVYMCAAQKLNPLLNEIHMEYRNSKKEGPKATFVTHIDAYRRAGAAKGEIDGTTESHGVDADLGFWVQTEIWFKGHTKPFTGRAHYEEYVQKWGNTPTDMWQKRYIMTQKCSEMAAWRKAGILDGTVGDIEMDGEYGGSENGFETSQPTPGRDQFAVGQKTAAAPVATAPVPAPAPIVAQTAMAPTTALPAAQAQTTTTPAAPAAQPAPPTLPPATVDEVKALLKSKKNMIMTLTGTDARNYNAFMISYFNVADGKALTPNPAEYTAPSDKLIAWLSDPAAAEANKKAYAADPKTAGALLAGRIQPSAVTAEDSTAIMVKEWGWPSALAELGKQLLAQWSTQETPFDISDFGGFIMRNGLKQTEHAEITAFLRVALKTRNAYKTAEIKKALAGKNIAKTIAEVVADLEAGGGAAIEAMTTVQVETVLDMAAKLAGVPAN